jgi:hypothetical protein
MESVLKEIIFNYQLMSANVDRFLRLIYFGFELSADKQWTFFILTDLMEMGTLEDLLAN